MWREPKTDWNNEDYFNAEDYTRIKDNLLVLGDLFPDVELVNMGSDKAKGATLNNAELTKFATNLKILNDASYNFLDIISKQYHGNVVAPNFNEFNYLESKIEKLYITTIIRNQNIPRLAITLGGNNKIKC